MTKKRNLFKKLGNTLIWKGVKFLQKAFEVKAETISGQYLKTLIKNKTGIERIWLADSAYYVVKLETIKDILKYDLVDEKEYEKEKYDCDDFAATIYSIFRFVFELNSMGMAKNTEIKDAETDKHLGWHRANIFVAKENGIIKAFYLEPQTDEIVELNGKEVLLHGKKYILNFLDF